jgi:uncharacterized protein
MAKPDLPSVAQFVVKVSKYCNLRCTYCYEYLELGNKERMSLAAMRLLFENVAAYANAHALSSAEFIWHGGEPFLIPIDYFSQVQAMQEDILGDKVAYTNAVQTNLTVLTAGHLSLLGKGHLFEDIGISFDVFGDQRVDTAGKLRTDTIVANMQKLKDAGIPFGAITVLARNTLPHVDAIYRYYDSVGVESRFLPFYMTAYEGQASQHALTFEELTRALALLADSWLTSERATPVEPISEYLDYAIAHMTDAPKRVYDRFHTERVYIVNIDGGVWGVGEAYDAADCYGNIFTSPFVEVLTSTTRRRLCAASTARMERYCGTCEYFGHCPGFFVAGATPEQQKLLAEDGCPVRSMIDHLVARLEKTGIKDTFVSDSLRSDNDALQIPL